MYKGNAMNIANTLKNIRIDKNLSVLELSEKIKISHQNIYRWESGQVLPSINQLLILADFYKISIDELLGRADEFNNIILNANHSPKEQELLYLFNQMSESRQEMILLTMRDYVVAKKANKKDMLG
jgi:transcriptional regulator with XRE-family HTH domain